VKEVWPQKYHFIELVVDDSWVCCKIYDENFSVSMEERTTSQGMLLAPFMKQMLHSKTPTNI
jgi:hypothetical protein